MPLSSIDNLTLPCAPLNYVLLSHSSFAVSQLISADSRGKDNFGPEGSTTVALPSTLHVHASSHVNLASHLQVPRILKLSLAQHF